MGVALRPDALAIDGILPRDVVRATSEGEVVDAIRGANERGEAVVVSGGATRLGVGDPPTRYDVGLDLSALSGIVEYEPDDLVATVRAGTTLAELSGALAARGQRWPIEPGLPERATVGGTRCQPRWSDSSKAATSRIQSPEGKSQSGRSPCAGL